MRSRTCSASTRITSRGGSSWTTSARVGATTIRQPRWPRTASCSTTAHAKKASSSGRIQWLRSRAISKLAEGKRSEDLLFGYHDRNWPRKWVARICKAAGVPRVTAHGMRGLHGTLAVETGLSAHAVASALGHESITTTLQSYAKSGAGAGARQQKVLTVLVGGRPNEQESAA